MVYQLATGCVLIQIMQLQLLQRVQLERATSAMQLNAGESRLENLNRCKIDCSR